MTAPATAADGLRFLLKVARAAQNTYVGRHWPDRQAMRRDGIGFGLNDGEHEDRIRRFLYECQPEFLVQYLEQALAAAPSSPGLDVERLARALIANTRSTQHGQLCPVWTRRRYRDGVCDCFISDQAPTRAAAIAAAYQREEGRG